MKTDHKQLKYLPEIKKIRILHFVHSLNEGGIERLLLEMCRKIDKDKFEIQICSLYERGVLAGEFESDNVKVHFLSAKRSLSIKNIFFNLSALKKIIKIIKDEKIDITHGHEFYSTVFSRISGVLAGVKKRYITLHNVYLWWSPGVHKMQRLLSHITTAVICNSNATLNYSLKHDRINKSKYRLIYNGIDCNKFIPDFRYSKQLQKNYQIDKGIKLLLTVGSFSHRKGYEYLIKAFGSLLKKQKDLILVMAGDKHFNEEDYFNEICGSISDTGLKDNIIITGNRNDINIILNSCDIFIMPSVAEGFGLALAEAMATEKMCIASDIEPFREIVDDGVNGFLFESKNASSLENKIEKILGSSEDRLREVRKNARNKIKNYFSVERMILEYEKLYSE